MSIYQPYDPLMSISGQVLSSYNLPPTTELNLTVKENGACLFSEALRTGLLQELMGHSARIVSMSTTMTSQKSRTTKVHIILGDAVELVASIENYSWTQYDKEFQALIEETLTE